MPVESLIRKATESSALQGALGGVAGGALVSALTDKKSARTLLKAGGLVAVGGLAYKAYQDYRSKQAVVADIGQKQFEASVNVEDETDCVVIQAMIAAAHADGQLTASESDRIWQQAVDQGYSADQLGRLAEHIATPPTLPQLATRAKSMEQKIEIYLASVLVMEPGNLCEEYLVSLQNSLGLPDGLVQALRKRTEQELLAAS